MNPEISDFWARHEISTNTTTLMVDMFNAIKIIN